MHINLQDEIQVENTSVLKSWWNCRFKLLNMREQFIEADIAILWSGGLLEFLLCAQCSCYQAYKLIVHVIWF